MHIIRLTNYGNSFQLNQTNLIVADQSNSLSSLIIQIQHFSSHTSKNCMVQSLTLPTMTIVKNWNIISKGGLWLCMCMKICTTFNMLINIIDFEFHNVLIRLYAIRWFSLANRNCQHLTHTTPPVQRWNTKHINRKNQTYLTTNFHVRMF